MFFLIYHEQDVFDFIGVHFSFCIILNIYIYQNKVKYLLLINLPISIYRQCV